MKLKKILFISILSFFETYFFMLYNHPIESYMIIKKLAMSIYVFLFFAVIDYILLCKYVYKKIKSFEKKKIYIITVFCIFFSMILAGACSLDIKNNQTTNLKIVSLGQKDKDSKGKEVWITNINVDGNELVLSNLNKTNGWVLKDNVLFTSSKNEIINWQGQVEKNIRITMVTHSWSGKIKVYLGSNKRIIDLNSRIAKTKAFNFKVRNAFTPLYKTLLSYMGMSVIICILLIVMAAYFINYNFYISNNGTQKTFKRILLYSLPSIIVFSTYLMAFYPASMTTDSFDQWAQLKTLAFNDWHPTFHTWINFAITRLWNSPAAISIFQIIFFSLSVGYLISTLEKLGVKKSILYIFVALIAFNPMNGIYSITLWKDIPYAISIMFFITIIINIYFDKKYISNKKYISWLLIIDSVFVALLRHNGMLVFILSYAIMIILLKDVRRRVILIFSIALIVIVGIKGPIFSMFNVKEAPFITKVSLPIHQIAAVVKYNGNISNEEKEQINKFRNIKELKQCYYPYSWNSIAFEKGFDGKWIEKNKFKFIKLWMGVCLDNPNIVTKDWLDMTNMVWSINMPNDGYIYTTQKGVIENKFGIKNNGNIYLQSFYTKLLEKTESRGILFYLLWRPAMYIYIYLFVVFLLCIRLGKNSLVISSPLIFNFISILIANPAQDYRYLYANTLGVFILIPLLYVCNTKETLSEKHNKVENQIRRT